MIQTCYPIGIGAESYRMHQEVSSSRMSAGGCSPPMNITSSSDLKFLPFCPSSALPSEELGPVKRNARRNLFGPPDPRSVQFAREKVEEIKAGSKKYWNFDFDREVPLDGRFKWERVGAGNCGAEEVPSVYACQRLPFLRSSATTTTSTSLKQIRHTTSPSSHTASTANLYYIPDSTSNSQLDTRESLLSISAKSKNVKSRVQKKSTTKQTKMSDFMKVRKRKAGKETPSVAEKIPAL